MMNILYKRKVIILYYYTYVNVLYKIFLNNPVFVKIFWKYLN